MLRTIELEHFRSYSKKSFVFDKKTTIISGPNASGKTNLLEAIWVLAKGHSFRVDDDNLVKKGQAWWRVSGEFSQTSQSVTYNTLAPTAKKHFLINGDKKQRLAASKRLPAVLFEPNDLSLLHGSPGGRRHYLDALISQLDEQYHTHLLRYERSLRQRNNTLKKPGFLSDELFVWDVVLSESGAELISRRLEWTTKLKGQLKDGYKLISGSSDEVELKYCPAVKNSTQAHWQQKLLSHLHQAQAKDRLVGFTTVGPHRDDFNIDINKRPAAVHASRGEVRSIVLSLKLAELELVNQHKTTTPLLLLDDVFSELDQARRQKLLELPINAQVIITTTNADINKHSKKIHQIRL